jgi:hypothetical protein
MQYVSVIEVEIKPLEATLPFLLYYYLILVDYDRQ